MSEPKLISPLLDGFTMGAPMSEHDGVQCCPAIKENTDKKYIVKIISIPATQVQMDALLLAGAYKDPADAMDYFKQVGKDVMKEAELLKTLSKLDGFLSYDSWQMEPITRRRLGYQVYLIGSYKRSLDKYVRRNPVTHLEAVNLGLDLCSALSVCRQAGALYVDLKPTNIFVSDKKEYSIGDLGFVQLDAMKYTALPDKYRSVYTPPELHDPMATLNMTVDSYAVGMILYQLYNDGQLPFKEKAPEEPLPTPINADYELAEIIMKAIHPDSEQRWSDPVELGKALASYLQRNSVNNVPITPHTPLDVDLQDTLVLPKIEPKPQEPERISAPSFSEGTPSEVTEEISVPPEMPEVSDLSGNSFSDEEPDVAETEQVPEDETIPGEADAEQLQPHEMSDELSRMLEKADELITHETPEGVVLPEIPDLPDPFAFIEEDSDEVDDSDIPFDPVMEDDTPQEPQKEKKKAKSFASQEGKKKTKKFFSVLLSLLVVVGIVFGVRWYYQNMYLQTVEKITIDGERDKLTVRIDSNIKDSLLTVICSDNYGNTETQTVANGQATFTDLLPNTMYKVQLEVDGFHKLVGQTSDMFTTDTTTSIIAFTAVTGAEDGSIMLNFTVDGDEPEEWTVTYSAEGEDSRTEHFSGHSVSIDDLSIGKVYTFTLSAGDDLSLSGNTVLEYMASRLILAEDLTVASSSGSDMTVTWKAPGDILVESWNVRCYSDNGYEQQLSVSDTQAYFSGIDSSAAYTVEVTAAGMTQPARTSITSDPINITAFHVDTQDYTKLTLSWEYTGSSPEGGWLLLYSISGSESQVIKCDDPTAVIESQIPDAKYYFTVQAADGTSIFNNVQTFTVPKPEAFSEYNYTASDVTAKLLKTPSESNWRYESIGSDDFTTEFTSGDKISIALSSSSSFYLPGAETKILYVIQDVDGNVMTDYVSEETVSWKNIWLGGDSKNGELNLPSTPSIPGEFVLNIYFDGKSVAELPFTIIP